MSLTLALWKWTCGLDPPRIAHRAPTTFLGMLGIGAWSCELLPTFVTHIFDA